MAVTVNVIYTHLHLTAGMLCLLLFVVAPILQTDADYKELSTVDPTKQVVVQLFEWKWEDVARECETFLSKYGYGAVQVSPSAEHINHDGSGNIPWWIKYQPVSYKICGRSGNEEEFTDMVSRCNKAGIRVIADVVTNHMCGEGQIGSGWCGSTFNSHDSAEDFPGVPFYSNDFNDNICDHDIDNYDDSWNVRKCRLVSLADINQDRKATRSKISSFLSKLVKLGVAGFRVDAAKHQFPNHLLDIFNMVDNLNSSRFPANKRPFVSQEVIDMKSGEAVHADEYLKSGRVTNFLFGKHISDAVKRWDNFKYFGNFGEDWGMWNGNDVLVFIDNHDNQRDNGGNHPLTHKDSYSYTMASTFMLAWPYGIPRVMSSYYFNDNDQGPPCCTGDRKVTSPSFQSDLTCDPKSGWVCEHRWPEIRRMTQFRSVTHGQPVQNVVTDDHRIAFSRGSKGFFVVNNNGDWAWPITFQTGLPSGKYCDIISGEPTAEGCSGITTEVDSSGNAYIEIPKGKTFGIHIGAMAGIKPKPTIIPSTTAASTPSRLQKTIVYLQKYTQMGQFVYLRGGTNNKESIPVKVIPSDVPSHCALNYANAAAKTHELSWSADEPGSSSGVPMYYTTNTKGNPCYEDMNAEFGLGDAYWKVELMIECFQLPNGWFEMKGFMDGWEHDVSQSKYCNGETTAVTPYASKNHLALCGSVNIFKWDDGSCDVKDL